MASPKKTEAKTKKADPSPALIDLTAEEMRALAKPRDGWEGHVDTLLGLYAAHVDELKIKGFDPASVRTATAIAKSLGPVEVQARKHLEMVTETKAKHGSDAWRAMMSIYAKAEAAARTNREIAAKLSDFKKFMATGPQKKKGA